MWGRNALSTTHATTLTLTRFLTSSTSPCLPTMRLRPACGLSRLKLGLSAWVLGRMPTWARLTTIPAAAQAPTIGATQEAAVPPLCSSRSPTVLIVTGSLPLPAASESWMPSAIRWTIEGPVTPRVSRPASTTTAPLRSCDLATLPCLRASSRRLGVAFSVLSEPDIAPPSSADPQGFEGGAHVVLQLGAQPAGDERHRGAHEQQAEDDLRRDGDLEGVERRDDARDHAEGGVGQDEGQQHGAGDLEGRGEHADERARGAVDEMAERRVLGQRHHVVGPREALDDPGVAADGDEHHQADHRVGAAEDRRLVAVDGVDEAAVGEADRRVQERAGPREGREGRGQGV